VSIPAGPVGSSFIYIFGFLLFFYLISHSTLKKVGMQAGWVQFSPWEGVCATTMAAFGFGERFRLLLLPCF
jgi:hypothetical protein